MSNVTRQLSALVLSLPLLGIGVSPLCAGDDPLPDVKARLAVEAQRIEREFTEGRSMAYKLVRSDSPRLVAAVDKLEALLALVQGDNALAPKRREVLIVTLKYDLSKVREIAGERRRASGIDSLPSRITRDDIRRSSNERRVADARPPVRDADSIIESRGRSVADGRLDRSRANDGRLGVLRSVDKSARADGRDISFPKNWVELSKRRSTAQKISAKEEAILKALNATIPADFDNHEFADVLDYLRKATGVSITVDQRAMEEMGVTYKTPITLKLKSTLRTLLKRMLGDLNMAYVVKDETILITSRERAKAMTTTRTYYLGDLAASVNFRFGPVLSKIVMMQNVNQLINTITQTVDPQSWKVNNPDAVGVIAFNPLTMSLTVVQTAEIHYSIRPR